MKPSDPTSLVVNVADLLRRPGARRHEELHGHVPVTMVGTSVSADADVALDVTIESVSEGVLATGTVRTGWRAECRRCLRPIEGDVEAEFRELFERHAREGETYPLLHEEVDLEPLAREILLSELPLTALCRADCRRCLTEVRGRVDVEFRELFEATPKEGETYPLGHEEIDLGPLLREALLLALPLAPLCEAACQGICPTCGADLNGGRCGCAPAERDPRWAALDDLHLG